jgi:hypothetical protein
LELKNNKPLYNEGHGGFGGHRFSVTVFGSNNFLDETLRGREIKIFSNNFENVGASGK